MKLKTTTKEMRQFYRILQVGYCELQFLLNAVSPFAYTCGVYGWNADYYEIDGVLIATGYRSMPQSKNVTCDYKLVRKYDDQARSLSPDETRDLLKKFIKEIKGDL